jgi:hypothetical protein
METEIIPEVEECIARLAGLLYKKTKGDWMQGDLQGSGRCPVLKMLRRMLMELPKIPSVVGLQGPSRRRKIFRWLKGLRCVLVEIP